MQWGGAAVVALLAGAGRILASLTQPDLLHPTDYLSLAIHCTDTTIQVWDSHGLIVGESCRRPAAAPGSPANTFIVWGTPASFRPQLHYF